MSCGDGRKGYVAYFRLSAALKFRPDKGAFFGAFYGNAGGRFALCDFCAAVAAVFGNNRRRYLVFRRNVGLKPRRAFKHVLSFQIIKGRRYAHPLE